VRLFLFDVDGTLVTARGAGRAAIARALEATYGTAGAVDAYDFRGRTDGRIVWDLMRGAGLADAVIERGLEACYAVYVEELTRAIGDGSRVRVLPGIVPLVRALAARHDALVGLLTGNIEAGARVKLQPTGLWSLFRVGAFGSDDVDRRRLPAIACARARTVAGRDFPFDRVTIIGDTPLDVDCARACGATAVAVATGFHPHEELAACAPDHLFVDFADVAHTVATLTGETR
jgi:phosphoglycolate phosphatase-like HAD superfamily hydrolase